MRKLFSCIPLLVFLFIWWRMPTVIEIILFDKLYDFELEHFRVITKVLIHYIPLALLFSFVVLGSLIHFFSDITKK